MAEQGKIPSDSGPAFGAFQAPNAGGGGWSSVASGRGDGEGSREGKKEGFQVVGAKKKGKR